MAIPGSKPNFEVHAKVRIGVKKKSGNRSIPSAVDYFVSDAPEFAEVAGDKPKELRARLIHASVEDAFSNGLEWWVKTKKGGSLLACYTKDGGDNPVALRMAEMLDEGQEPLEGGRRVGNGRVRIACPARECPHFGKDCKPMGRLVFVVDGDPLKRVYELDTKGWNSIENIEGALRLAQTSGPLTGRLFVLTVGFEKKGTSRFPVLSIREEGEMPVQVNDEKGVAEAEAVVLLAENQTREGLAAYLDAVRPGWKDDERYIARIKEVGVPAAIEKILERAQ